MVSFYGDNKDINKNNDINSFPNVIYNPIDNVEMSLLQYTYYELRKKGKVKDFLKYFPEHASLFNTFRNDLHNYTKKLYHCYKSCYIKKEKPVKEFPYEFKTHII